MINLKKNDNGFFFFFHDSLVYDATYVQKMKKVVTKISNLSWLMENAQTNPEFLKYEIRKLITQKSLLKKEKTGD